MALKSIPVRTVTVNRSFLLEIKSIKDLQNEHIVRSVFSDGSIELVSFDLKPVSLMSHH